MRKQRIWLKAALAIMLCTVQASTVYAGNPGWNEEEAGIWYQYDNGAWPQGEWALLDGKWYYFNEEGYMQTGWLRRGPGLYYLGQDGAMWSGMRTGIDGKVYEIDSSGCCTELPDYSGWIQDKKGWWYRDRNGTYPVSTWKELSGKWYHFNGEGYMQTGFIDDQGKRYYLAEDGAMCRDTTMTINGVSCTFDASGAMDSQYKSPVPIPSEEEKTELLRETDRMADQILGGIIHDAMSQREKAAAIYQWIRGNVRYVSQQSGSDWEKGAYDGLLRRRGDCFTYYSVSVELLARAGISSIQVIRSSDNNHFWNLVYVDGAWYHFDTTPRSAGGNFCLLTDSQIEAYSAAHGGSHQFDRSLYPPTP